MIIYYIIVNQTTHWNLNKIFTKTIALIIFMDV